ncbi:hypothetical protein PHYPO_G00112510 [Pangasianodon hypophthalmus]|uniref:Opioid growth factor receptor (OGFr) conserved domain-containing protein n=1 Tax=Pangasianodon hypophthalmus TaxID=310915 RepID=A0A5N5L346_PANHP|nr:hypothetical protein PHYPO_G00112510 [Pangasianodon hypophthalmus]
MGCEESVMDDSNNEYDSTWDDESEEEQFGMMRLTKQRARARPRNLAAAEDMQNFRRRCRENTHAYQSNGQMTRQVSQENTHADQSNGQMTRQVSQENRHADQSNGQMTRQVSQECQNLLFYRNRIPFRPDGVYIEQFHKYWFGDYTRLERVHSYIQWLFPTQEPGVNNSAHVLTPTEIRYFHEDVTVKKRLFKSYILMLDFYGIELVSQETGKVKRAVNWKERFANLNRNTHNNLRITRILKCLGLLGFCHYQAPLVRFLPCGDSGERHTSTSQAERSGLLYLRRSEQV